MEVWVTLGFAFWGGFFGFWVGLWVAQFKARLDSGRALPYESLRAFALVIAGMVSVMMVWLTLVGAMHDVAPPLLALWLGAAVGLGHFFVFPEAWWRGRRGFFWNVE